jgi:3'-phosphoadenosine 5'-phosphosulfate sulfotransferase (PAPS reductase)/FAD synthetase
MSDPGTDTCRIVSVSGGKDSTATALLALDADPSARLVFADTGNEHELTYEYIREYLPRVLGRPIEEVRGHFADRMAAKREYVATHWGTKGVPDDIITRALTVLATPTGIPFLDLCLWKGRFPSRMAQFCTQELKRYPIEAVMFRAMEQGYRVESWRGVRKDESHARRQTAARERAAEGWEVVHPIADWSADQVVTFIRGRGVELNPLYRLGMGRVGCMPCINCTKDELAEIARRFPQHIDKIREWEALLAQAAKLGFSTFFTDSAASDMETPAEIYARLNIDARVTWARTTRGGKQFDLFKTGEASACQSVYGLCE